MNRRTFLLYFVVGIFAVQTAYAATPTPTSADAMETPTPTTETPKQRQIDDLKERLATKVAELAQLQRRAIIGTVKSTSVSTAVIETKTKDVKIELLDEIKIAQVIKGKRTDLTVEDLAKDDLVVVFGDYDTTLDLLKAKVIFITSVPPARIAGTVTAVDEEAFVLTVAITNGPTYTIDVEKTTKTNTWDKTNGLVKAGFTKIAVGDSVHIVGTPVPKKENRLKAARIFDVGNQTGAATGPTPEPTTAETSSPSAVSPTKKPTPKPTAAP